MRARARASTPLPPLSLLCVLQALYIASSRELKRLDSLAFSPIFQHFSESLQGLPTIRAFRKQELFMSKNRVRRRDEAPGEGGGREGRWQGGWLSWQNSDGSFFSGGTLPSRLAFPRRNADARRLGRWVAWPALLQSKCAPPHLHL